MKPVPFSADEAMTHHIIFYSLPQDLDLAQIDPMMRPVVEKINASGWVWTAECCQGHPDYDGSNPGWDHNPSPFLRLVCEKYSLGDMLGELVASMRLPNVFDINDRRCRCDYVCPLKVFLWSRELGPWEQINVYVEAHNVRGRDFGIEALTQFADRVCASPLSKMLTGAPPR